MARKSLGKTRNVKRRGRKVRRKTGKSKYGGGKVRRRSGKTVRRKNRNVRRSNKNRRSGTGGQGLLSRAGDWNNRRKRMAQENKIADQQAKLLAPSKKEGYVAQFSRNRQKNAAYIDESLMSDSSTKPSWVKRIPNLIR